MQSVHDVSSNAAAKSAPGRALCLEKPRASSGLHGESGSDQPSRDRRGPRPTRRGESHFGTKEDVSLWDGPRLTTSFAAQVIAQALNAAQTNAASAQSAYRGHSVQIPSALVLDDKI